MPNYLDETGLTNYDTKIKQYMDNEIALGVPYITTAPTANNTTGKLIFVVLTSEPGTYYNGYYYIITEA